MEHGGLYWPWWCSLCLFFGLCALRSGVSRCRLSAFFSFSVYYISVHLLVCLLCSEF